jgi:hypothetical protein
MDWRTGVYDHHGESVTRHVSQGAVEHADPAAIAQSHQGELTFALRKDRG